MFSARNILAQAEKEGWAVPHFNFSNLETLKAIVESAKKLNSPVFVGTSEGESKFVGLEQAVVLVNSYKKELPIFLNADHTKDMDWAKKAIDAGYDMVLFDGSKLSFEENIENTKKIIDYAKKRSDDIIIEGELGYLKGESKILKEKIIIEEKDLTKPDKAAEFIKATGVDMLAIAIGNIHGIQADIENPRLDLNRLSEINKTVKSFLVLHGGSGTPEEDVREAIGRGINVIHINTEIRIAYTKSLRDVLENNAEITTPYKIFPPVIETMKDVIENKMRLFGSVNSNFTNFLTL